jgi:hypothetical protein
MNGLRIIVEKKLFRILVQSATSGTVGWWNIECTVPLKRKCYIFILIFLQRIKRQLTGCSTNAYHWQQSIFAQYKIWRYRIETDPSSSYRSPLEGSSGNFSVPDGSGGESLSSEKPSVRPWHRDSETLIQKIILTAHFPPNSFWIARSMSRTTKETIDIDGFIFSQCSTPPVFIPGL